MTLINSCKIALSLILIDLSLLSMCCCKNYEFRLIQLNNLQRQELLQQKCDKYNLDNNIYHNNSIHSLTDIEMEHLLIDRKHKFLYCYVPKVRQIPFLFIYRTGIKYGSISLIMVLIESHFMLVPCHNKWKSMEILFVINLSCITYKELLYF